MTGDRRNEDDFEHGEDLLADDEFVLDFGDDEVVESSAGGMTPLQLSDALEVHSTELAEHAGLDEFEFAEAGVDDEFSAEAEELEVGSLSFDGAADDDEFDLEISDEVEFLEEPDETTDFPAVMGVDYVRVYERTTPLVDPLTP